MARCNSWCLNLAHDGVGTIAAQPKSSSLVPQRPCQRRGSKQHDTGIVKGKVERYALPQLGALNLVLHDALGGGVTRSMSLDAHGKCLGAWAAEGTSAAN